MSACQSTGPTKAERAAQAPPVSGPAYPVAADEVRTIKRQSATGELIIETRMLDAKTLEMRRSKGCTSTTLAEDRYAPRPSWSGCRPGPWGSGTNHITSKVGQLWPFEVGNKVSYKFDSTNADGRVVKGYRNCEVVDTVMATAMDKEYATYKISCKTHYGSMNYYYAPAIQTTVLFEMNHNRRGKSKTEFVAEM